MQVQNQELFESHAETCKMLANPKRLMLLDLLGRLEMSVGEMADALDVPMTTVSQHLRLLKDKRLVLSRKEGQTVYYKLRDPRLTEACQIIRTVLLDDMKERHEAAAVLASKAPTEGP